MNKKLNAPKNSEIRMNIEDASYDFRSSIALSDGRRCALTSWALKVAELEHNAPVARHDADVDFEELTDIVISITRKAVTIVASIELSPEELASLILTTVLTASDQLCGVKVPLTVKFTAKGPKNSQGFYSQVMRRHTGHLEFPPAA